MDALICKQPYFQWDTETHSCLGCIEEGKISTVCINCDDYYKNTDATASERKI